MNGPLTQEEEDVGLHMVNHADEDARSLGPKHKSKQKKRKIGFRPVRKKSRGKSKNKKESDAQVLPQPSVLPGEQTSEQHKDSAHNSAQSNGGVVRNPVGQFQPTSSVSASVDSMGSHVESIGDSGIVTGNSRFDTNMERIKATKLWRLAKDKLGVSADDDEDEMFIERLRAMEEKAEAAKRKKGNKKGSK